MTCRRIPTVYVSLLLICIIGLSGASPPAIITRGQGEHTIYLPMVLTPPPELNGFVTYQGQPTAGVPVHLLACHSYYRFGRPCFYFRMATTDSQGRYNFTQAPTLPAPTWLVVESYKVRFESRDLTSPLADVLAWLELPDVYEYTSGAKVQAGDFDIVAPTSRTPPSSAALPQSSDTTTVTIAFRWTPRKEAPTEGYVVGVYSEAPPYVFSDPDNIPRHTDAYTLTAGYSPTCEPYLLCPTRTYTWTLLLFDMQPNSNPYGQTQGYTFTLPLR